MKTNITTPVLAVIEDNAPLRDNLILSLEASGFAVWGSESAEAFYREAMTRPVSIALIDLGLPGESGLSAIGHLRQIPSLGIIVITASGSMENRIAAMEAGADHYFVKPIKLVELVSAIDALWRRLSAEAQGSVNAAAAPPWQIDPVASGLRSPQGVALSLSPGECALLLALAKMPGEIVPKAEIYASVFPGERDSDGHRLDVMVSRLRKKVKEHQLVLPLRSIFGKGLVFTEELQVAGRNS